MSDRFRVYVHHGILVWVNKELKGKHKEYCLCYSCKHFMPEDREKNCAIANLLYAVDVATGLVTPVWECPEFEERRKE